MSARGLATPDDSRFQMSESIVEWNTKPFVEGEFIHLGKVLRPATQRKECYIPDFIYVRREMCQVFDELTERNRKKQQIVIGSPGVGKSVLLLLVAMHRVLADEVPTLSSARRTMLRNMLASCT